MVLKVKIQKCHLHTALSLSRDHVIVRVWKAKQSTGSTTYMASDHNQQHTCQGPVCEHRKLKLTTWNCRGFTTGEPYIYQLAEDGSDIIVVTEHWLWPYEAKQLSEVHPAFVAECSTDSRLHEKSDLARGCGGVGVMFRKSLNVSPISNISSDRICGIRVHLTSPEPSCITVLAWGVSPVCRPGYGCLL